MQHSVLTADLLDRKIRQILPKEYHQELYWEYQEAIELLSNDKHVWLVLKDKNGEDLYAIQQDDFEKLNKYLKTVKDLFEEDLSNMMLYTSNSTIYTLWVLAKLRMEVGV
jgi:DNA-binding transcriptional regulator/RsmH inhibitor MraZ